MVPTQTLEEIMARTFFIFLIVIGVALVCGCESEKGRGHSKKPKTERTSKQAPPRICMKAHVVVKVNPTKKSGDPWDADGSGPEIVIQLDGNWGSPGKDKYKRTEDIRVGGNDVPIGIYDKDWSEHDTIGKSGSIHIPSEVTVGASKVDITCIEYED
ncbi:MAG: hypothetical protein ABII13_04765 [Patescibacteria group bacterium]